MTSASSAVLDVRQEARSKILVKNWWEYETQGSKDYYTLESHRKPWCSTTPTKSMMLASINFSGVIASSKSDCREAFSLLVRFLSLPGGEVYSYSFWVDQGPFRPWRPLLKGGSIQDPAHCRRCCFLLLDFCWGKSKKGELAEKRQRPKKNMAKDKCQKIKPCALVPACFLIWPELCK